MFKTTQFIVMAALCLNFTIQARSQNRPALSKNHTITGKVISTTTGEALPGAVIKITTTNQTVLSNDQGAFTVSLVNGAYNLSIYYLGHKTSNISIQVPVKEPLLIALETDDKNLQEVEIISTGYQNIPKERATGSFSLIDNELVNRKVSTNILDRLDGVTSGLIFNKNLGNGNNADITIRGRSTIFANPNPLIVLDNFPFDGDINDINPNDIENVSVLKDAAAASIWGVRAGNGVIVITTKKGKTGAIPTLSFNSNLTIANKPNLWSPYQMSSTDYIDLEKFLFDKGNYNNTLSNAYTVVSPAVALMDKLKRNQISVNEYEQQIAALKQVDIRNDLDKYMYRNAVNQQYNLNVSGGNNYQKYFISGGFDKNLTDQTANSYSRFTVNANNTISLLKDKLEIFSSVSFTKSKTSTGPKSTPYTPYDQYADPEGNPLPVVNASTLRATYTDTAGNGKLLNWQLYPLHENRANNFVDQLSYRVLTGISYKIIPSLKVQANYQYQKGIRNNLSNNTPNSFYTRNFINRFSSINSTTNVLSRLIPVGNINTESNNISTAQYGRVQLNYDTYINEHHQINAIAGYEVKDYNDGTSTQTYYGVDNLTRNNVNGTINPLANYTLYYNPASTSKIPTSPSQYGSTDRSISYYANASYAYKSKYTLSLSARKDETNIFGVKSNQKGVPLWSAGFAWNLSDESFYHLNALPYLKLRLTYGYNGNADKSTSAYLTAGFAGTTLLGSPYSQVINPPNPSLAWERVQNINLGLDFGTKNNRLSGSIEYYIKSGKDLIGESPIAPQTGIIVFKGNSANTRTKGIDLIANIIVLNRQRLQWSTNTLYSYTQDKITAYKQTPALNSGLVFSNYANPLVGYPYYSIFTFKSAGLDGSGDPQGYLNGEISKAYSAINNSSNRSDIDFIGSRAPTSFGSIRNTLSINNWSLSANVIYKLGYYFRRSNVFSGSTYSYLQGDFNLRWQKPGDEQQTNVPALVYPNNGFRGQFYQGTRDLIEKGDHIRLQDVRLSYGLNKASLKGLPLKSLQVYSYINNLGILWRANSKGIDPDANTHLTPAATTFSFGLTTTF